MKIARLSLPLLLCATLAACAPGAESSAPAKASQDPRQIARVPGLPNVVILTLDTLRADHLQCYGYQRATAPTLELLAAESILFERAFAPMATTLPTHTSLFTGTYPSEHGVTANVTRAGTRFKQSQRLATLAMYMQSIGYQTQAFISALPLKKRYGLAAGFDGYAQSTGKETNASDTTEKVLSWLNGTVTSPYLLWIHYFDPHAPYIPPEGFDDFATDEHVREYVRTRNLTAATTRRTGTVNEVEQAINLYDGEILFMDSQLARVMTRLRARDDWNETIVIVVGDHGEGLNQHGEPGHGFAWNEQLHVPFWIRVPGVEPHRRSQLASLVDVAPTLLGLVDWPNEAIFAQQLSGQDLFAPDYVSRPIMGQTSTRQEEYGGKPTFALTTERWKYIRTQDGSEELLFDLAADPYELEDVAGQFVDEARSLRAELESMVAAQLERARYLQSGSTEAVSARDLEDLKSMGYGGGDEDE